MSDNHVDMAAEPHSVSESDPPRKRRKTETKSLAADIGGGPRWRNEAEQQIYSSKLVGTLRRLRLPESASVACRTVRGTADWVLAVTAGGRTRWSRGILAGRVRLRLAHVKRRHRRAERPAAAVAMARAPPAKKRLPPVQKRVKVLSRLVPGCRKASLQELLEETTDYIAALEMQVKAMAFVAGLLNGGGGGRDGGDNSVAFRNP